MVSYVTRMILKVIVCVNNLVTLVSFFINWNSEHKRTKNMANLFGL